MSKSSFLNNKNVTKSDIAIICILLMVSGLLISRLFLSLGMVFFGINALWNIPPRRWLQNKWWLLGLGWVLMYALSWFWSDNKQEWGVFLQLKLPVLLLPISFTFLPPFTGRQLQRLTLGMGLMLLAGAFYSVSFLVRDYAHFIAEYNISHMLPTPVYGDYICFSSTCALFVVWTAFIFPRLLTNTVRYLAGAIAILLAIYLHILASKSGLIALYLFAGIWAVYTAVAKRSLVGMLAVLAIPAFLYLAVSYIPTLRERKEHIVYTWYRYMDQDKSGKLGDLSRLISYDIALKIIKEKPMLGVGTGDMLAEMNIGYDKWHPEVTEERNRLIPHNQFLTIALGCGIPATIIFTIWLLLPLITLRRNNRSIFFVITWLILLIQLMIEPFLESQFGVFVFLYFFLIMLHSMNTQPQNLSAQTES